MNATDIIQPAKTITYEQYLKLRDSRDQVILANKFLIEENAKLQDRILSLQTQVVQLEHQKILTVITAALEQYYN